MSFEPLSTFMTARAARVKDRIAVQGKAVVIRLCDETLDKLGWKYGDHIDVQVGRDQDLGIVRLVKSTDGWRLHAAGAKGHHGLIVKIGKQLGRGKMTFPGMPDRTPSLPIVVAIKDRVLEFRLPWIKERDPSQPFAIDNVRVKPNGSRIPTRPATHVPTKGIL